ncbi:MAG: aminotransferase, partial [Silicimonas sp.]|nr:aminotransferase [Silicimonas sp.]
VGSSFQFRLPKHAPERIADFVARCSARGVELKWFGAPRAVGFRSTYRHWAYAETPDLPQTDRIMAGLLDMRLPLTFSVDDCAQIACIIREEAER